MDYSEKPQNILSFCTGYGGIERGLELAGLKHRVVAHVEIEAFACANLVAKMEKGKLVPAPVWTDIKTFPVEKFRGRVHGITGGYPCQSFSVAGKRKGEEDPRHLWPHIRRAVDTIRPEWCFFENVEGHLSKGIVQVLADLEGMGYAVEAGIFSAEEVGAPHRRKRVFILAHSRHIGQKVNEEQTTRSKQSGEDLAHTNTQGNSSDIRLCGFSEDSRKTSTDTDGEECGVHESSGAGALSEHESQSEELADTCKQGLQRRKQPRNTEEKVRGREEGAHGNIRSIRWPSRPGEPQHEWEEPRTVRAYPGPKPTTWKEYQDSIKSLICGTSYGYSYAMDAIANRVDRLRLCGNGVVPQTAAKAWIVLNENIRIGGGNDRR